MEKTERISVRNEMSKNLDSVLGKAMKLGYEVCNFELQVYEVKNELMDVKTDNKTKRELLKVLPKFRRFYREYVKRLSEFKGLPYADGIINELEDLYETFHANAKMKKRSLSRQWKEKRK